MIITNNCVCIEVAGQIVSAASSGNEYIWVTEQSCGSASNVLEALKAAAQQAVRESRHEELQEVVVCGS